MQVEQRHWTRRKGWECNSPDQVGQAAQLVLLFGSTATLKQTQSYLEIQALYPNALILGCSTAGEICGAEVFDDSLVTTAVEFEQTQLKGARIGIGEVETSFQAGERLARSLDPDGLIHVFVLSEGIHINGSDLVRGLTSHLPTGVTVTGGLAGDGERFQETVVVWDGKPQSKAIAAIGFYSDRLKVGYGSLGGWDPFGTARVITRSEANILYELDGQPALTLYKRYLGDQAEGLPATGLLFPLSLINRTDGTGVVRTMLSVDEAKQSITFAGDVPEGASVRLMKANFNRLVGGATEAAKISQMAIAPTPPQLAVLVSCVGRKLVLKQRIEEEVEGVQGVLGDRTILAGFYSYGEISPFAPNERCELHNQTMTITTFAEP